MASDAFPVVFKPVWEPFGEEAEKVVDRLIKEAQWPTTGPKAIKYRVVVASFLKAAQGHLHTFVLTTGLSSLL